MTTWLQHRHAGRSKRPARRTVAAAEPRGAELVERYIATLGIPADAGVTEEMVREDWELEKRLRKELLESTPENRWEVFERCYTRLYTELEWVNRLCFLEAKAPLEEVYSDWQHLIGDPPKKVHEVGSGKGGLIGYLAERGFECKGTEVTRERGAKWIAPHPNLSWGITDGVHLDRFEPADSYDAVISDQVIEHLHPDDLLDHFRGALAILRPKGRYVFATPHAIHGPLDLSQVFKCDALLALHLKEYTYGEIAQALKQAGFARVYAVLRLPWKIRRVFGGRPWPTLSRPYLVYLRILERVMAPLPFPFRLKVARAAKAILFYGVVVVAEKGW